MRSRLPWPLFLIAFLSACATTTPDHVPLNPTLAGSVQGSEAVFIAKDTNLAVDINESHLAIATGGGLIPALIDALIDSTRMKNAENTVAPMRSNLGDFDLAEQTQAKLEPALKNVDWLKLRRTRISHETSEAALKAMLASGSEDAFVAVVTNAMFTPAYDALRIDATISVIPRKKDAKAGDIAYDIRTPIYKDTAEYVMKVPDTTTDKAGNVSQWSKDDARLLRQALDEGINNVTTALATKLSTSND